MFFVLNSNLNIFNAISDFMVRCKTCVDEYVEIWTKNGAWSQI
jgi:hypothetical protein